MKKNYYIKCVSDNPNEKKVLQVNLSTQKNQSDKRLTNSLQQSKPCHLEDILLGAWPNTARPLGLCKSLDGKLFRYHDVPDFIWPAFVQPNAPIYPDISNSTTKRGFNKYGTNFVYQSYKIGKGVTIADVVAAIKADIDYVKKELKC